MSLLGGLTQSKWRTIDAAGAAVLLAISAGMYAGGVGPMLESRSRHAARLAELEAGREASQKYKDAADRLKAQVIAVQEELTNRPMRLQPARMLNQRHADVTRLATEAGLEISELQPRAGVRKPLFQTIPIHLAGSGTYRTAAAFLHRLHKKFPDTGVSSFELTANPAVPVEGASCRFELVWYAAPGDA